MTYSSFIMISLGALLSYLVIYYLHYFKILNDGQTMVLCVGVVAFVTLLLNSSRM